jgi:hypothetical protein
MRACVCACAVLDQVSPDVFLVSSKADDRFIDLCSDSSMNPFPWARYTFIRALWCGSHLGLLFLFLLFGRSGRFWGLLPDTPPKGFQTREGAQQSLVSRAPLRPPRRYS